MEPVPRRSATAPEGDFRRWREHGDATALGRVFDLLAPELLLVAAHLAQRNTAEDLVQATFVAAITDAARWQHDRPLMPWLVGILANLARRERSRTQRRIDGQRLTARPAEDPPAEAEREETARLLAAALQGMPRHYRHVLTLRLVHGLEPLAIAQSLGAPPATIKSRLQRGLAMLQRALPAGLRSIAATPVSTTVADLSGARSAVLAHAQQLLGGGAVAGTAAALSGGLLLMNKLVLTAVVAAMGAAAWVLSSEDANQPNASREVAADDRVSASTSASSTAPTVVDPTAQRVRVGTGPATASTSAAAPRLHGLVVDGAARPLPNVEVFLGDKAESMFESAHRFLGAACGGGLAHKVREAEARSTRTANDGSFELDLPTNGRPHLLVAFAPERGCRAIDAPETPTAKIELVLPQDPVTTGVVRAAADRKAIADARINCWPARSGYPVEFRSTDDRGEFRFLPLPAGEYRLQVEAEGFAPLGQTFQLVDGAPAPPLELELTALPAIDLRLVDANEQAWTPTRIASEIGTDRPRLDALMSKRSYRRMEEHLAEQWDVYRLRLDEFGRLHGACSVPDARIFSLWCAGEKLFEVAAVDVRGERLVAAMLPRTTIPLEVAIARPVDAAKAPSVRLAITDPAGFVTNRQPIVERTTASGRCVLPVPGQFAGTDCGLLAESDGCAPFFTVVPIPAKPEGIWQRVTLLPGTQSLRGTIETEDGTPVAGARLLLADRDGRWYLPPSAARGESRLDGSFAFEGLPPLAARLLVVARDCAPRAFDVDPREDALVRLALRSGRELLVEVPEGVQATCTVVRDGRGRLVQDDRMEGSKHYGRLSVRVDPEAAAIEVFDGATGESVGEAPIPASDTTIRLEARGR